MSTAGRNGSVPLRIKERHLSNAELRFDTLVYFRKLIVFARGTTPVGRMNNLYARVQFDLKICLLKIHKTLDNFQTEKWRNLHRIRYATGAQIIKFLLVN